MEDEVQPYIIYILKKISKMLPVMIFLKLRFARDCTTQLFKVSRELRVLLEPCKKGCTILSVTSDGFCFVLCCFVCLFDFYLFFMWKMTQRTTAKQNMLYKSFLSICATDTFMPINVYIWFSFCCLWFTWKMWYAKYYCFESHLMYFNTVLTEIDE